MLCEHLIKNHDNVRRSESLTNKLARSNRKFLQKIRTINSQCDPPVSGSDTTGNIHDVRDGHCELIDSRSTTGRSMTPERVNVKRLMAVTLWIKHSNQSRWTDHVADLHNNAIYCFVMWCNNGTLRQGWLFELIIQTGSQFKYALRTIMRTFVVETL